MNIPEFSLERFQSLYEHHVEFNLSESGVHPLTVRELLAEDELDAFLDTRLIYEQTNGPEHLRDNISLLYEGVAADNILVTNGTIEANFVTFMALLSAGDELVYMLPNYQQFKGMAEMFGVTVRPFYLQEEHGWQPDLDALSATVTNKTKVIALCNPNNPTGVLLSDEARAHIINLASQVGAWLVVDEIYRGSEHNGQLTPSFWGSYDKVIVTSGLSKAFGLPGLRIGWMVAPEHITERAWGVKDYTSITASTLSYDLATRALTPALRSKIWGRNINLVKQNLAILAHWVEDQAGLFSLSVPDAAAMAFVKYHADVPSETLADRLHKQQSVLVVPGAHFGLEHFVRIGYGLETDKLRAALARLAEEVKGLELVPH
jgi:aspartate/methionine/tyrosine aminotransferase